MIIFKLQVLKSYPSKFNKKIGNYNMETGILNKTTKIQSIILIKSSYLERYSMESRILSFLFNYTLGCCLTPNYVKIQRELQ
jgi:hypothetical protein